MNAGFEKRYDKISNTSIQTYMVADAGVRANCVRGVSTRMVADTGVREDLIQGWPLTLVLGRIRQKVCR